MLVEKCEAWRVGGKTFFEAGKARDYVESVLFSEVKSRLLPMGFGESECFKVAVAMLENRARFADLLSTVVPE